MFGIVKKEFFAGLAFLSNFMSVNSLSGILKLLDLNLNRMFVTNVTVYL